MNFNKLARSFRPNKNLPKHFACIFYCIHYYIYNQFCVKRTRFETFKKQLGRCIAEQLLVIYFPEDT